MDILANSYKGWIKKGLYSVILLLSLQGISTASPSDDLIYTMRPGDNLWDLAGTHLKEQDLYKKLQQYNNIQQPLNILPGTKIRFPINWLKNPPLPAMIIQARGDIKLIRGLKSQDAAPKVDDTINAGDQIITGTNSNLVIQLADQSELIIFSNTHVIMDAISSFAHSGNTDTRIRVQYGRIKANVKPAKSPQSNYQITTPAAVTAIRGTSFRVSADKQQPVSRTEVIEGTVGVTAANTTRTVPFNFGTQARKGHAPLKPRKLLPPAQTTDMATSLKQWPLNLSWPVIKDAVAYRVQIGAEQNFNALVIDQVISQATYEMPMLDDGTYIVRLRGIDNIGLEGNNADHKLLIDARPFAPELKTTSHMQEGYLNDINLSWAVEDKDISEFRIQVAKDTNFTSPVIDQPISNHTFQPKNNLQPGQYFWHVASQNSKGKTGPYSSAQSFKIKPQPEAPTLKPVERDEQTLTFHWDNMGEKASYRFQLALDETFTKIIADNITSETQTQVTKLTAATYYYRIQTTTQTEVRSAFSETQTYILPSDFYWPSALMILLL